MENCWFVLKQTHYPAPDVDSMRKGKPTGPISLGHVIRDLKHLDQVINAEYVEPFTRAMQIHQTKMQNFQWNHTEEGERALEASVGVPVPPAPGLTVNASIGFAFRKSVKNYWEFEHLDRYIVQPTQPYLNECLESEEVSKYVERSQKFGFWSFFMITGLIIARGGGKNTAAEAQAHEVSAGVNL
ncbi:hypothetical protein TWF718_009856 [Orbilia javanica]|uniref:Uncharacterized protein n=1 Tax=Orbilia javanica TaxID=47235 RepID=A0AAN8MN30_9PEZI